MIDSNSAKLFEKLVKLFNQMAFGSTKSSVGYSAYKQDLEGENGSILRSLGLIDSQGYSFSNFFRE